MVRYFMANVILWSDSFLRIKLSKLIKLLKIASEDSGRFFYDNYNLLL